jgi:hypothetical protein
VLYVMLAGRPPWDEIADPEARLAPRPLVELAPHVPEALDTEIRRALSTRAQNRPSGAQALLDSVREAASGSDGEPEAAETARLRSGAHESVASTHASPATTPRLRSPASDNAPHSRQRSLHRQRKNVCARGALSSQPAS